MRFVSGPQNASGWHLLAAMGLSLACGRVAILAIRKAAIATPLPEPGTHVLMAADRLLVGARLRRKIGA